MREQIVARLKEAWPELLIVGEASNGREAIAMVQSLEPDIVFLDISMPEMDGIEAARALAGQAHVVFVTAHDQYAISAFEHGAVDYLLKPAEPERVALTCQRLRERLQARARSDGRPAGAAIATTGDWRPEAARIHALGAGQRRRQHPDDPDQRHPVLPRRGQIHARADRGASRR